MKQLKQSTQFKKDLKRVQNQPKKLVALETVLNHLRTTGTVPKEYNPHQLSGNYKVYFECHVLYDFLLIWVDEEENIIKLVRFGSHSELFG
jgi:mRNA interferase YafQ